MPIVYPKCVFSFLSEDTKYPAKNLLEKKEAKSWKCKSAGELTAQVILELEKPVTIVGIDIGNECSAFVTVMVGRKQGECAPKDDDYQTILLTSSFMVPVECRNLSSPNRVRCFVKNALVEDVAREKWNLIRIECTQPFNKNIQFGLKFITIHALKATDEDNVKKPMQLGRFMLREDSPDSDKETSAKGSLFSRWKETKKDSGNLTQHSSPAAKIRAASTSLQQTKKRSPSPSRTTKTILVTTPPNRNRSKLLYDDDDERPDERMELKMALDKSKQEQLEKAKQDEIEKYAKKKPSSTKDESKEKSTRSEKADSTLKVVKPQRKDRSPSPSSSHKSPSMRSAKKRHSSPASPTKEKTSHKKAKFESKSIVYKPFNKLLEGVVLVISGIQNPERADIRQKAFDMGAKYKSDWDKSCTHLICAFKNTPKYTQVKDAKGIITNKDWVLKCHSQRKRIPWRRFALDRKQKDENESEDEILDERSKPSTIESKRVSTDSVEEIEIPKEDPTVVSDSECDTEDEIEKALKEQADARKVTENGAKQVNSDKQDAANNKSTDEDENYDHSNGKKSPQPLSFAEKLFYLHDSLSSLDFIKLKGMIKHHNGDVTDKLSSSIDYLISDDSTVKLPDDFRGEFLKPLWVYECDEMDAKIPTKRYRL